MFLKVFRAMIRAYPGTATELAARARVNPTTLSRFMQRSDMLPNGATVIALAWACGKSDEEIRALLALYDEAQAHSPRRLAITVTGEHRAMTARRQTDALSHARADIRPTDAASPSIASPRKPFRKATLVSC